MGISGLYTINTNDFHPIIGQKVKDLNGFYLCNGFSGHGFKLSPAVGSILAQQITNIKLANNPYESDADINFLNHIDNQFQ